MRFLRANTQVKMPIGPFVDKDNGTTPETAITLSGADEAEIMKHDASAVTDASGATWAAITGMDGYYNFTFTASHTDTEGALTLAVNDDSLCLPVKEHFMVLSEAAYDSLFIAKDTGFMDVDVKAWAGQTSTLSSTSLKPEVDIASIHDDATAALNAEAAFDGSGYNVGNGSIVAASVTGNIGGLLNGLNTQAKTDVKGEVVAALATDTYAERGIAAGPPAATSTIKDKINWMFMLARNKVTNDGATQTLFDDAGTGTVSTASVSDAAGTTSRSEWS